MPTIDPQKMLHEFLTLLMMVNVLEKNFDYQLKVKEKMIGQTY
jgi:predicted amino acid-binding ACT domain protein